MAPNKQLQRTVTRRRGDGASAPFHYALAPASHGIARPLNCGVSRRFMRFADPLAVTCPSCGRVGSYATRELLALRVTCQHCAASLEAIGREMRSQVAEVRAYVAKMDMALELERMYGVTITDAQLDSLKRPSEFAPLLQGSPRRRSGSAEDGIVAALALVRRAPTETHDLHRDFAELFPF